MLKDKQRKLKAGLSKRMNADAERRKCPECGRKSAIRKTRDGDWLYQWCQWCKWEKGSWISDLQEK